MRSTYRGVHFGLTLVGICIATTGSGCGDSGPRGLDTQEISMSARAASVSAAAASIAARAARRADRESWFQQARRAPEGSSAASLRLAALEGRDAVPVFHADSALVGSVPDTWVTGGPAPLTGTPWGAVSGRVTSLALDLVHDATGNTLYVGSAYGGVWKTTNGRSTSPTYVPISDATQSLAVGAIALNTATNPPTIFVGTGEANRSGDSYYGVGIMKSTNGGGAWSLATSADNGTHTFFGLSFSRILIDPVNPQIVIAAAVLGAGVGGNPDTGSPGIYRSTDGGATWSLRYGGNNNSQNTSDLVYDSTRARYVAANQGAGFFVSTDQGNTWTALPSPFAGGTAPSSVNFDRASLTVRSGTLFGLISDQTFNLSTPTPGKDTGLVQSTDGGNTWTPVAAPASLFSAGGGGQGFYDQYLAAPAGSTELIAAGIDTYVASSVTGTSTTWTDTTRAYSGGPVHPDEHAIAVIDATHWYVGNDGGVYRTDDGGNTWTDANTNLGLTQFYSATPDPFTSGVYIGGTQDNGTTLSSASGSWKQIFGGDGGYTAANPGQKLQYFYQFQGADILRSDDGGSTTVTVANSSTFAGDFVNFIMPFKLVPTNPAQLVAGTSRVWRGPAVPTSTGSGWTPISPPMSAIDDLAVAPTSADVIYAATGATSLWKTTNATSASPTWTQVTPAPIAQYCCAPLGSVAIHPTNPNVVFLGVQGFGPWGHVYTTTNGGTSWTDITGNLPVAPVNAVLIDPLAPSVVYAASDVGVFVITDGGAGGTAEIWQRVGTNLPDSAVLGLKLASTTPRQLVAATHGRGVWTAPAITPPVQINCAGPAVAPYVADVDFSGGSTIDHANTIDLSGVTNPAPKAVYQSARIGNFSYTIPGLVPASTHTVRLHFAETYFQTTGSRVFDVSINGTQVLTNFDIVKTAGAANKALVEQFSVPANSSGSYVIQFTSVVNNSLLSGVQVE